MFLWVWWVYYERRRFQEVSLSSRELIRMLLDRGWILDRVKGSHHVFVRADKPYHISLPHPEKDLATGTLHKLLKLMD
ncbi:type II toxin-antitoxin system HicA family toxin [Pantoea sp. EA-12]|uniref:type II toxin-antitoxin system HicA family toxin n=1 Tax=Pantoea sp. EA-12 TaxID=3043303 RepID=UPI0032D5AE42